MTTILKKFHWSGLQRGMPIKGIIHADSVTKAKKLLTQQRIEVRYIYQVKNQNPKLSIKKQVLLFKQFSTLLNANIPLLRTMRIIENANNDLFIKKMMRQSIEKLQQGNSVAIIFDYLDHFCLQILMIGEKTGRLDQSFEKIAAHLEKKWQIKKNIIKTLSYPTILLLVSLMILIGLLIWVVPQFQSMFNDFHASLPLATQLLIATSDLFSEHFLFIVNFIGILFALFYQLIKIKTFNSWLEKISFKIPIISFLKKHHYAFQFFLSTTLLFETGMSITDSLLNVKNSIQSNYVQKIIHHIILKLKEGYSLHEALQQSKFFPSICVEMTQVAEETGKLEDIFHYLTQYHQQQFNDALTALQQLLEPGIMLIISILVGLLLLALYLPMFKLGSII